jgi:hypothetical protein
MFNKTYIVKPNATNIITFNKYLVCKHFLLEHSLANQENGKCLLFPQEQTSDYFFVDGINNKKKIDYHYCATARNLHHMCGEEGQFFIKK